MLDLLTNWALLEQNSFVCRGLTVHRKGVFREVERGRGRGGERGRRKGVRRREAENISQKACTGREIFGCFFFFFKN